MLVTIVVFTIVMGAITATTITGLKHQSSLQSRSATLAQVRATLERIDRDIRSANPLCSASSTTIVMGESVPTARVVSYSVGGVGNAQILYNAYTAAGSTCGQGAQIGTQKVLLSNLVNTTSVFSAPSTTGAAYDTCNNVGTTPSSTAGTLIVTLSAQPSSLTHAVSLSDCGTDLRNVA